MNIKRRINNTFALECCSVGDIVRFLSTGNYYLLSADDETETNHILVDLETGTFIPLESNSEIWKEEVESFCHRDCDLILGGGYYKEDEYII